MDKINKWVRIKLLPESYGRPWDPKHKVSPYKKLQLILKIYNLDDVLKGKYLFTYDMFFSYDKEKKNPLSFLFMKITKICLRYTPFSCKEQEWWYRVELKFKILEKKHNYNLFSAQIVTYKNNPICFVPSCSVSKKYISFLLTGYISINNNGGEHWIEFDTSSKSKLFKCFITYFNENQLDINYFKEQVGVLKRILYFPNDIITIINEYSPIKMILSQK